MVDDERYREDPEDGEGLDPLTGDPVEARFDVEVSGETDDDAAEPSEQGHGDDADFDVDARGEDLPPELAGPPSEAGDRFELELLDPSDPGITREDLEGADEEHGPRGSAPGVASPDPDGDPPAAGDDRYAWLYDEDVDPPPAIAERYAPEGGSIAGGAASGDAGTRPGGDAADDEEDVAGDRPPIERPAVDQPVPGDTTAGDTTAGDDPGPVAGEGDPEGDPDQPDDPDGPDEPDRADDPPRPEDIDPDEPVDWERFTGEHHVASTQEYLGLAEELTRTEQPSEPIPVSAGMPGLESGVVGLEDVVGESDEDTALAEPVPDLGIRVLTGAGLVALFVGSLLWAPAVAMLSAAILVLAAGELYAVLVANRHHPVAAVGLLGVAGGLAGTWVWGLGAVPVAVAASLVAVALFIGTTAPRPSPLTDTGLTVLVVAWIGGLGAFAIAVVDAPDYRWLIASVVGMVAVLDIGQYFAGRRYGKRLLAPAVSPGKTVEGLIGGAIAALGLGVVLGFVGPLGMTAGLLLAGVAIVLGPLGDLSVSLVKRLLAIKDMGTVLPGHGGILDRIDALLFVLPAAWVVFRATGLLA